MNSASVKEKQAKEFAMYLLEGKTQTEAYKLTHPDSKATDAKISVMASRYANDQRVKEITSELQEKLKEKANNKYAVTKEKLIARLASIAFTEDSVIREDGTKSIKTQDVIKAIDTLNKMLGFNEAEKVDVELDGQVSVKFEGSLNEWSE